MSPFLISNQPERDVPAKDEHELIAKLKLQWTRNIEEITRLENEKQRIAAHG